jgi:hypothetical protein
MMTHLLISTAALATLMLTSANEAFAKAPSDPPNGCFGEVIDLIQEDIPRAVPLAFSYQGQREPPMMRGLSSAITCNKSSVKPAGSEAMLLILNDLLGCWEQSRQ